MGKTSDPEWICQVCERSWPERRTRCPQDGAPLVAVTGGADPRLGQVIADAIRLEAPLGRGGMGTVYRAVQLSTGREVAVKLLLPERASDETSARRFLREARSVCRLNHPNIVVLIDYGQCSDGTLYLMMELLEGRTLAQLVSDEGPLPVDRVVSIGAQLCSALHHAHERGLVHRDLKPANVFVLPSGIGRTEIVKVVDFGVAKAHATTDDSLTDTGAVCGTPAYMSPEQVMGAAVGPEGDVYALGVVLYEMLAGRRPIEGASPMKTMMGHVNEWPRPLQELRPDLPPAMVDAIMRALSKSAVERPPSAAALGELLASALDEPTVSAVTATHHALPALRPEAALPASDTGQSMTSPRSSRHWLVAAALVIVAFAAGTLLDRPALRIPLPEAARVAVEPGPPAPPSAGTPAAATPAVQAVHRPPPLRAATSATAAPRRTIDTTAALVRIHTTPPGATIIAGGRALGRGSAVLPRPAGERRAPVLVRHRGFRSVRRHIDANTGDTVHIRLRPEIGYLE